jgi:CHASE2 domain-containing sensor protein
VSLAELKRDLVILACATSAGIHGALAPRHFDESTGAGLGFAAATALLAGLVVWLTRRPASSTALATAAATFAGLLASYALAVTTGLPVLHPDPEPVDGLALATKAIEAAGLLAASSLLWRPRIAMALPQPKGTLT